MILAVHPIYTGPSNSDYRAANGVSGDLSYDPGTGVITFGESVNSVNGLTGTVVLSTQILLKEQIYIIHCKSKHRF